MVEPNTLTITRISIYLSFQYGCLPRSDDGFCIIGLLKITKYKTVFTFILDSFAVSHTFLMSLENLKFGFGTSKTFTITKLKLLQSFLGKNDMYLDYYRTQRNAAQIVLSHKRKMIDLLLNLTTNTSVIKEYFTLSNTIVTS